MTGIVFVVTFALCLALSYAATAGVLWLICLCFRLGVVVVAGGSRRVAGACAYQGNIRKGGEKMTGIERLRELAGGTRCTIKLYGVASFDYDAEHCLSRSDFGGYLRDLLGDIADQIEREQNEMVADSPYDALPPEDRDAIAWVREHGGLDKIKRQRRESIPRDAYERKRDGWLDHIAECETALRRRNARIAELERERNELRAQVDAMRPRLMPEGMEWPRFEDGEPVRIGDQFAEHGGCKNVADSVEIGDCWFKIHGFDGAAPRYSRGASVKRPAPKVLDADGAEIRARDHVWHVETGQEYVVVSICYEDGIVVIRAGDETSEHEQYAPSKLTHERPDSWERLEEDARMSPSNYCLARGLEGMGTTYGDAAHAMARDLVRRARALAGGA